MILAPLKHMPKHMPEALRRQSRPELPDAGLVWTIASLRPVMESTAL
jgi:hypothetical protein